MCTLFTIYNPLKSFWLKSYYLQILSEYSWGALEEVNRGITHEVIRPRKMENFCSAKTGVRPKKWIIPCQKGMAEVIFTDCVVFWRWIDHKLRNAFTAKPEQRYVVIFRCTFKNRFVRELTLATLKLLKYNCKQWADSSLLTPNLNTRKHFLIEMWNYSWGEGVLFLISLCENNGASKLTKNITKVS